MEAQELQKLKKELKTEILHEMSNHLTTINDNQKRIFEKLENMEEKFNPILDLFLNTKGFQNVSLIIIKAFVTVGVALGMLYGFVRWLKGV